MELMTLDDNNQPLRMVEGYDSLIWTERFSPTGDFQISTGKIEKFMTEVPDGTKLTLRETNVPMIAEYHYIERKKNQPEKLVIKGRSYDSILDRRVSIQSVQALTGTDDWIVTAKTPSDVAYYIIVRICVYGDIDVLDIFPAADVVFPTPDDYDTSTGPVKEFTVDRGNLLSTVTKLLETEAEVDVSTDPDTPAVVPHGLRAIRPSSSGTAIGLEIYAGTDRSAEVYFDATRDLLDDGNYLFSTWGYKNVGYGVANGLAGTLYEGASEPSGLDRRVMLVDASESDVATEEVLFNEMNRALSQARKTAIFDGSLNQDLSPYVFGVDYGLGDIVQVSGDYGLYTKARVTEYIRTEDATGTKSYPTLSALSEEPA